MIHPRTTLPKMGTKYKQALNKHFLLWTHFWKAVEQHNYCKTNSKSKCVHSHFPHNILSSYKYLIHHQSENSFPHRSLQICSRLNLKWLTNFERIFHSLVNMSFWHPFLKSTRNHTHSNIVCISWLLNKLPSLCRTITGNPELTGPVPKELGNLTSLNIW